MKLLKNLKLLEQKQNSSNGFFVFSLSNKSRRAPWRRRLFVFIS